MYKMPTNAQITGISSKLHESLVELVNEKESRTAVELGVIKDKVQMAANVSIFTLVAVLCVAAILVFPLLK